MNQEFYISLISKNLSGSISEKEAKQLKDWAAQNSENASIKKIINLNSETTVENANQLREAILQDAIDNESPTNTALVYLKTEVRKMY